MSHFYPSVWNGCRELQDLLTSQCIKLVNKLAFCVRSKRKILKNGTQKAWHSWSLKFKLCILYI